MRAFYINLHTSLLIVIAYLSSGGRPVCLSAYSPALSCCWGQTMTWRRFHKFLKPFPGISGHPIFLHGRRACRLLRRLLRTRPCYRVVQRRTALYRLCVRWGFSHSIGHSHFPFSPFSPYSPPASTPAVPAAPKLTTHRRRDYLWYRESLTKSKAKRIISWRVIALRESC